MIERVLALVYSDLHSYVFALAKEPLQEEESLKTALNTVMPSLAEAQDADRRTASALVTACFGLLGRVKTDEERLLAQIAIRYLVISDDGDDDTASLFGFDDDAELLNAVCEVLGYPDLRVHLG